MLFMMEHPYAQDILVAMRGSFYKKREDIQKYTKVSFQILPTHHKQSLVLQERILVLHIGNLYFLLRGTAGEEKKVSFQI